MSIDVERGIDLGLERQDDLFVFASLSVILGWDYANASRTGEERP